MIESKFQPKSETVHKLKHLCTPKSNSTLSVGFAHANKQYNFLQSKNSLFTFETGEKKGCIRGYSNIRRRVGGVQN